MSARAARSRNSRVQPIDAPDRGAFSPDWNHAPTSITPRPPPSEAAALRMAHRCIDIRIAEEIEVGAVTELPVAESAREFLEKPQPFELRHQLIRGPERHTRGAQPSTCHVHADDRMFEQQLDEPERVEPQALDEGTVVPTHAHDRASRHGGFGRGLRDAPQEESEPALPVAVESDRHQPVVVLGLVSFQEVAEIQQWPVQNSVVDEKERNEEAPDPAVAVREWVDRFELGVSEAAIHEGRPRSGTCECREWCWGADGGAGVVFGRADDRV